MARMDLERMKKYRSIIRQAGQKWDVDPALIAGIISRESRAGNQLHGGWDKSRTAFGLMQVGSNAAASFVSPKKTFTFIQLIWFLQIDPKGSGCTPEGNWDSVEHLIQATEILVKFINQMRKNFNSWTANKHLKGLVDRLTQISTPDRFLPPHV